jgi:Zn-dependent protease
MLIARTEVVHPLGTHLRRYNLVMDHRSQGEEPRGPIFRSDLEGPKPEPRYEPLEPEGGLWGAIKRWLAPLAGVGLLLAKFKGLALVLLKIKFLGTALTMLISIGAYALLFPVWFAVGIVVLIWVHEMGHVVQLRREGIAASAPMFIPFLGAFVAMKQMPKDALAEARVGLAGPVLGTLGGLAALGLYALTGNHLFLGLAYFDFIINLFNLAPMLPLDGGRAVGAMSLVFQLLGLVAMVGLFFVAPIMAIIALIGVPELWRRWKMRDTPEGRAYYDIPLSSRVVVGLVYVGLILVLGLLTGTTFVSDPASLG